MRKIAHVVVALAMAFPAAAEFRTWTDRNGNSMEAELVRESGKEIVLRDSKGKTHWIDPEKLSDEDRLFLNPPPPEPQKHKLSLHRSAQQKVIGEDEDTTTVAITYECSIKIDFLTDDASHEGLKGGLFILGQDDQMNLVVLEISEGPVEMVGPKEGRVEGAGFSTTFTKDEDHNLVQGVQYHGFLMVLYAGDGTVLETRSTRKFLVNNVAKTFSLNVGDRFNEQCEMVSGE